MDQARDQLSEPYRAALKATRERLRKTQNEMADLLGMSLRAYSDIENGVSKCRQIHFWAAERLSVYHARMTGDRKLLAPGIEQDIDLLPPKDHRSVRS